MGVSRTGIFQMSKFDVKCDKVGKPIWLAAFGDVHKGNPLHADDKWKQFLKWGKSEPDALFIGMGDYLELCSTKERESVRQLHGSSQEILDDLVTKHINELASELEFMRGRCIGLVEGNHHAIMLDGKTSTQHLAKKLGCAYLGALGIVRLKFSHGESRTHVDVVAHHGMGGARLSGGSLNRVCQMAEGWEGDIYIMGHDHKSPASTEVILVPIENLKTGEMTVVEKKKICMRSGSFLRGYVKGKSSYVADSAMRPTVIGAPKVKLTPHRDMQRNMFDGEGRKFYIDMEVLI